MKKFIKSLTLCILVFALGTVTFFAVSAQEDDKPPKEPDAAVEILATVAPAEQPAEQPTDPYWGSYVLLRPDVDPMLGVELFASDQGPDYFSGETQAGGSTFIQLGNGCA